MPDRIGQQLGNYRLVHLLGQGGFAEVYLGQHQHLGTQAAIKVLRTQLADAQEVEKFRAEARTIANLRHPNIVRMLDFGVEEGIPYLIMDYAPNGTLRQRHPKGQPVPMPLLLQYVKQIASALHHAHEMRLIHRDIKPENILLGANNEVLLTDFGIAIEAAATLQQRTMGAAGTSAYAAPEQLHGHPRPPSDQYSLGIMVYEWLCGERPFQGSPLELAGQHAMKQPPSLRQRLPSLAPAVEEVVFTALAKDPQQRFGSVSAFANALEQAVNRASVLRPPTQPGRAPTLPPGSGAAPNAPAAPPAPSGPLLNGPLVWPNIAIPATGALGVAPGAPAGAGSQPTPWTARPGEPPPPPRPTWSPSGPAAGAPPLPTWSPSGPAAGAPPLPPTWSPSGPAAGSPPLPSTWNAPTP
jgi:serine/threonine protein kinase